MQDWGRRRLLRATGTGLVATTIPIAGCLGSGDGGTGGATTTPAESGDGGTPATTTASTTTESTTTTTKNTTTTAPDEQLPAYLRWPPAASGPVNADPYQVSYNSYDAVRAHRDALDEDTYSRLTGWVGAFENQFGADADSLDAILEAGTPIVVLGSFDPGAVVSTATGNGWSEAGNVGSYRLVEHQENGALVAVGSEALLVTTLANGRDAAERGLGRLIGAGNGETERYVDANGDYAAAVEPLGDVDELLYYVGERLYRPGPAAPSVTGVTAVAQAWTFGDGSLAFAVRVVFGESGQADADAVREWFGSTPEFEDYADPSVSTEGRVVALSSSIPIVQFDYLRATLGGGGPDAPQVSLDFEYDADAGTVRVRHLGGDSISTDNTRRLEVRVAGEREATWELPVRAGDEITVEASSGSTVRVVWVGPDGASQVLASYDVP